MKFKKIGWSLFLLMASFTSILAQKITLSGSIKDLKSGETIIGASIFDKANPLQGALSNEYGFYSLTLPKAEKYTIVVSFIGFETQNLTVDLTNGQNKTLNIQLGDQSVEMGEVVIKSEKANKNITSTEMSSNKLDVKEISKIPVIFGEKDILKTIQLLPGIKSAGEGNAGFYVRGGGVDQNLILLDEATIYNASHLLGFFSVFNSDAIKDVIVYKGGMPAQYGGRLSSVLDIKMNDGNNQKYVASGGIGLIASRLTLEGPIQKDKSSFIVSGRRTYADAFLKFAPDTNLKNSTLYFYDFNVKTNYQINEKNRLFLSGYFGRDKFGVSNQFGFDWGNATGTLRWNHIFNSKLFSNTSLIYSNYNYAIKIGNELTKFKITSAVEDWNLKQDFQYYTDKSTIRVGFNSVYHRFEPSNVTRDESTSNGPTSTDIESRYAWENGVYVSDEFSVNDHLKVNAGLRLSTFSILGAGTFYSYNARGIAIDSSKYKSGEFAKTYWGVEPRLALNYVLDPSASIKLSYARTNQYVQLLSNANASSPTDLWIPASENVKPQVADQIGAGFFKNFADNTFEASAEIYYKTLQNQIDYRPGAQLQFNRDVEADLLFGKGWSYGIELFLKKKVGKLNGWIGYTWSKTERKFAEVNGGIAFPARQDRRHDISIVGIYDLTPKWNISATWVYNTGNAITFPSGKYILEGAVVNYYTERNGYRFPDYHRLDIGATYLVKKTKTRESSWNFSVYNAYNRKNAFQIDFRQNKDNPQKTEAVRTALFGAIPSATWNFKF